MRNIARNLGLSRATNTKYYPIVFGSQEINHTPNWYFLGADLVRKFEAICSTDVSERSSYVHTTLWSLRD